MAGPTNAERLCVHILSTHFGPLVGRVGGELFTSGSSSLRKLVNTLKEAEAAAAEVTYGGTNEVKKKEDLVSVTVPITTDRVRSALAVAGLLLGQRPKARGASGC